MHAKSRAKLEWPSCNQRMRHSRHSKQVVNSHVMRSANGEFLLKFGLSYITVNFYLMARYPSIAKTFFTTLSFLGLVNISAMLTTEKPSWRRYLSHTGLHVRQLQFVVVNTNNALPMWPIGLVIKSFRHESGPRLNIKTVLSKYGDFHVKDKTAVRTSYL